VQRELSEVDTEISLLRGKVEDSNDWKKVLKSKIEDSRNIKLCYEMVTFLSGETPFENLNNTEMQTNIRNKLMT
jgi:hypothetical protein